MPMQQNPNNYPLQPNADGEYVERQLADGRTAFVTVMAYGKGRINVSNRYFPGSLDTVY